MSFELVKEKYNASVRSITFGKPGNTVTVGGATSYPFYLFEGSMPNKPKVAMEVWDMEPDEWPEACIAPFKDVINNPPAWAKKCQDQFGADIIVLQLKSTDPNGQNKSPEDAAAMVNKVLDAINVPLIVWGVANTRKDEEVLKVVCEKTQGRGLTIGPVEEKNHKGIGAAAMGFGQTVISSSPIDVNIAKQVNILLENLGVGMDKVLIDPTTGGLGYGMEYGYSVMERLRMAGLIQGDDKLQGPIINNLGNEVWKSKETKLSAQDAPTLGDPEKRGILMESVAAVSYLLAGSDILIVRHPETARLIRSYINLMCDGGTAQEVKAIQKNLGTVQIDLSTLAPKPDLTIEAEKKAEAPKKSAPAKAAAPKAEAAPAPKAEAAPAPKAEAAPAPKVEAASTPAAVDESRIRAEIENRIKTEMEAKVKAEANAKAKEEAAIKAKAEAESKKKADDAAKKKAEADALIEKLMAEENELRKKIAALREKDDTTITMPDKKTGLDLLALRLDRMHKRG